VTWWLWLLVGWVALAVPVAIALGRAIALADRRREVPEAPHSEKSAGGAGRPLMPPRDEQESA
jgi:hypothetical protein